MSTDITLTTASANRRRQAACDGVVDLLDVGAAANPLLRVYTAAAVLLVTFTLPKPAFGAATLASPSVATLLGVPISAVAVADGVATNYEAIDCDAVAKWTGTVGATGSGEGVILDNTTVADGMTRTLTSLTVTQA